MLGFSDANPDPWNGPHRLNPAAVRKMWSDAGWRVDSMDEGAKIQANVDLRGNGRLHGDAILMLATRLG